MRNLTRLLRRAALLVAVATLATACFGSPAPLPSEPAPEPRLPDACALLSEETVASLVGPTLPEPDAALEDVSKCVWNFGAAEYPLDATRYPDQRWLYVSANAVSQDWCMLPPDALPIDGVGRQAVIQLDAETFGDSISYCLADVVVTIAFASVDVIGRDGRGVKQRQELTPGEAEETLLRLAQETERRLADAPQRDRQPSAPASSEPAPVVDPCVLVSANTVADLGVTPPTPSREVLNGDGREGRECIWPEPGAESFTPGHAVPLENQVAVTVVEFADRAGHDAAVWADLYVEQWAIVWPARELAGLGDRAAVATDDLHAVVWTAHGTSAIKVEFRRTGTTVTGDIALAPAAELEATAERIAREVVANLPR